MFKVTIKTPERHLWSRSGVFVIIEHISHIAYIVNFEQVNAGWINVEAHMGICEDKLVAKDMP